LKETTKNGLAVHSMLFKKKILHITAKFKSSVINVAGVNYHNHIPPNMNMGKENDLDMRVCVNCGQIVGEWPMKKAEKE
jgi:hypothetical protein